jgi:cyclophilin family peptidyl-prolyl cis-trans isomerase
MTRKGTLAACSRARLTLRAASGLIFACLSPAALAVDVRLCTSEGAIVVELDERNAPLHAANFARYAESGYYTGTVLHRVVAGSMVQGGSFGPRLERRRPGEPVRNESGNRLSNERGTIAASRGEDPDSATSQFFFNLADNAHLDATPGMPGYTVFGRVKSGLEVLDRIAALPTRRVGDMTDVPDPPVELESVALLPGSASFGAAAEPAPEALEAGFEAALAVGDPRATLASIDALRRSCLTLDGRQHVAEAEAAFALGMPDRARYGLEQYLASATTLDPELPRAQRLYAGLPAERSSDIDALLASCQMPVAPSIPDGRTAELMSLRVVESEVLRYRQSGEFYLDCITRVLDEGTLGERDTIDATARHNAAVVEMTAVLTRFNEAARAYKASNGGASAAAPGSGL